MRTINIAKDIIIKYEPKEVIRFVSKKLKEYNRAGNPEKGDYRTQDPELQLYIDILLALDEKMNGTNSVPML